jgi:hypothetical protein
MRIVAVEEHFTFPDLLSRIDLATLEFIEWASKYDTADDSMRSLRLHRQWMTTLPCRSIRLEGDLSLEERLVRLDAMSA